MQERQTAIPPRRLGGLLDETFAVYGRHFWRFMGLVAIVQAPITVVSEVLVQGLGSATAFLPVFVLGVFGTIFVYGAGVFAVGQHYVSGNIGVRTCYTRAWWRILSLAVLALVTSIPVVGIVAAQAISESSLLATLALVLLVPSVIIAIYWSMAIQTVMVESYRPVGALGRSFRLILGGWWRIFGITLVIALVVLGLSVLVAVPFFVLSSMVGGDPAVGVNSALLSVGDMAVSLVVLPVLFIAGTLLYYDLRVRKEEYDFSVLSRELGIATA